MPGNVSTDKRNARTFTPMNRVGGILAAILLGALTSLAPQVANAAADPDPIATVVAKVSPAVVRILTVRPPKPGSDTQGAQVSAADQTTMFIGSGFIIDPSGFIATNKHVVEGTVSVVVVTADGVHYQASVVGMPAKGDMALLRIHAGHPLPSVRFGDSDKVQVGDTVVAIGSPFGFQNTVTSGIISAVNRDIMESPFDDYFQTDAAINHGNSGGPLFNLSGEVIGMNSVIIAPGTGFVGLAFSIPSKDLQFVFDRLMKTGQVNAGMLPIHTQQVTWMLQHALGAPSLQGALVSSVQDDHETMLHGKIKPGDVVLSFNGEKVWDPRDLARMAARAPVGSDAILGIYRGGAHETVHVTVQGWPDAPPMALSRQQKLGLDLASGQSEDGKKIVTVAAVDPNGTAADSGIQKGDVILEVQQTPVTDPEQAQSMFRAKSSARHGFAAVLVERDKKEIWVGLLVPDERLSGLTDGPQPQATVK
jgi:serine protease Do